MMEAVSGAVLEGALAGMRIFGAIGALVICAVVSISAGTGIGLLMESIMGRTTVKRGERRKRR